MARSLLITWLSSAGPIRQIIQEAFVVSVTLETQASPAQGLAPKSTRPEPSTGVGSFAAIIDSNATQAAGTDGISSPEASVKPSELRSISSASRGTGQGPSEVAASAKDSVQDQADQTETQEPAPAAARGATASAVKGTATTTKIVITDSTDGGHGVDPVQGDQAAATTDNVPAPIATIVIVPFSPASIAVPVTTSQAPAPLAIAAAAIATSAAASAPVNFAPAQSADSSAPSASNGLSAPSAGIIADALVTTSSQAPDGAAVTAAAVDPTVVRTDVIPDHGAAADAAAAVGSSQSVIAEATTATNSGINDGGLTAVIATVPVAPKPVLLKTPATAATTTTAVGAGKAPDVTADEVPATTGVLSPVPTAGVAATAEPTATSVNKTKLDSESAPASKTDPLTPAPALATAAAPAHTLATEAGNLTAVAADTTSLTGSNIQAPSAPPALAPAPTWNVTAGAMVVPLSGLAIELAASIKSGKSSFQIRLDPAELGRIDVRIDVDRTGRLTSHLTVEKAETLAMLRQDAPQLQRALDGTGLKTGDNGLQFSLRDQSSQNSQGQSPGSSSAPNLQRLVITEDDQVPAPLAGQTYGRMLGSSSGVDIRV